MNKLFFGVIILVILIVILLPKHLCAPKKWQCEQYVDTINTMKEVNTTIRLFKSNTGYFPRSLDVLTKTLGKTGIKYLESIKTDRWGNPFTYIIKEKGEEFLLYSIGINSKDEFGKGDDIVFESRHNRGMYCD